MVAGQATPYTDWTAVSRSLVARVLDKESRAVQRSKARRGDGNQLFCSCDLEATEKTQFLPFLLRQAQNHGHFDEYF